MLKNKLLDKLPSIPDYFRDYVDSSVDLNSTTNIPCPFHHEQNGKSFSYSPSLKKWRCWGRCHCGGDVIDLHRLNYGMDTKEAAEASLCNIFGITVESLITFEKPTIKVEAQDVYRRYVYGLAIIAAKDVDSWIELDYIVSKVPYDINELSVFCTKNGYRPKPYDEFRKEYGDD